MFGELINKLKPKKKQLKKYNTNSDVEETKPIVEEKEFDIKISKQGNIYKIEISDYISIIDFVDKKNSSDEYKMLDLLCNRVLWNGRKQKVNKGIYYVINTSKSLYNILFTDDEIDIEERINIDLDIQSQKENIIQDRAITFKFSNGQYNYFSAKHESNGNTYYTRYYNKNGAFKFGNLELTEEEAYEEINTVFSNLETISGIETILDMEFLKEQVLNDLRKDCLQKTKKI